MPGPRSRGDRRRGIAARRRAPALVTFPIVAVEARGATITDVDGNTFIDFAGGVGCLNVGHSHPHGRRGRAGAARRASRTPTSRSSRTRSTSSSPSGCSSARRSPARRRRRSSTPAPRRSRTRSSSRAPYTGRPGRDRVRGRVPRAHAALALADLEDAPVQGRARAVRARGLPRRRSRTSTAAPRRGDALAALERAFLTQVAAENVAAIVIEPVQGEGGFVPRRAEFLAGVRRDLRRARDRVRRRRGADRLRRAPAGSSRSSTTASSPTSSSSRSRSPLGLPLSGVLGKAAIMDAPGPGAVGGTYVGNPVAQAAALAVLDVIDDEGLVERVAAIGETIRAGCSPGRSASPTIGDVRGLGAMLAIEFVLDRATKEPAPELASASSRRRSRAACCCSRRASTGTASACSSRSSSPTPSSTRRSASGKRRSKRALSALSSLSSAGNGSR